MGTFWTIGLILLWIAVILEGALLLILFRQLGFLATGSIKEGVSQGSKIPTFNVFSKTGEVTPANALLSKQFTLFLFGSLTCSTCMQVLKDTNSTTFLDENDIRGCFITKSFRNGNGRHNFKIDLFEAGSSVFRQFGINRLPFAYIINKKGTVVAKNSIGNIEDLEALCEKL